jgi:hypothetical protein
MFFCPKCEKIVSEEETKNLYINDETIYNHVFWSWYIKDYPYNNQSFIGGSSIYQVICGVVREPTPEEYFIHYTLKCK